MYKKILKKYMLEIIDKASLKMWNFYNSNDNKISFTMNVKGKIIQFNSDKKSLNMNGGTLSVDGNKYIIDLSFFGLFSQQFLLEKYLFRQINGIINNKKYYNPYLITIYRAISHEIAHVFDPLIVNDYYTSFYIKRNKKIIKNYLSNQTSLLQMSNYFNSEVEYYAYLAEYEGIIYYFKNNGFSSEQIYDFINNPIECSYFEDYLKNTNIEKLKAIKLRILQSI